MRNKFKNIENCIKSIRNSLTVQLVLKQINKILFKRKKVVLSPRQAIVVPTVIECLSKWFRLSISSSKTHECEIYANKYLSFLDKLLARFFFARFVRAHYVCVRCVGVSVSYFDTNFFFAFFIATGTMKFLQTTNLVNGKSFRLKIWGFCFDQNKMKVACWTLK